MSDDHPLEVNTDPVTRFAPSPTGYLHLGHAYAALFAFDAAQSGDGRFGGGHFILRIEDIDRGRCRAEFEDAIFEDLAWLGLIWREPVRRQSDHFDDYAKALKTLDQQELLYPCFCTRKDIKAEIARAGQAPHIGPEGPLYPGTCRDLTSDERKRRIDAGNSYALRLDITEACSRTGPLTWTDQKNNQTIAATPELFGDVILARKDTPTSYHLACTLDDHLQGITLVTRGEDLFSATHVHRLLQALLGLDTPNYHHHELIKAESGERLAKRDRAQTIRSLRETGLSPKAVRKLAGVGSS